MADWGCVERRTRVYTGPESTSGPELAKLLHQVFSDWREMAQLDPKAEVPSDAVTVSAAGGVLAIRAEVADEHQSDAGQPEQIGDHRVVIDPALGKAVCVEHGEQFAVPTELNRLRERAAAEAEASRG